MSAKDNVILEALRLSEAERLEVADALYESLEGPADPDAAQAWDAEIKRRIEKIDSGAATLVPWEEARRRIMADDGDAGPAR